jgi:hypothetical protein
MAETRFPTTTGSLPPLRSHATRVRTIPSGRRLAMIARGLAVVAGLGLSGLGLHHASRPAPERIGVAETPAPMRVAAHRRPALDRMASALGPSWAD